MVMDDEIDLTPPDDEDDHDVEGPPVFDLALRKTTAQTTPVTVGNDVDFEITIFNQGSMTAQLIEVIDYLPDGFDLSPNDTNGWTDNLDGTLSNSIAGPIAAGDSAKLTVTLRVNFSVLPGISTNYAEIVSAWDEDNVDRTGDDLDSTPDTDDTNEAY